MASVIMEGSPMPQDRDLLAWIEPQADGFMAAFVGAAAAPGRAPATQLCASPDEAQEWVEEEAATLGLRVKWVDRTKP